MLPLLILLTLTSAYAENCSYEYEGIKLSKRSILTIKGLPTNLVINPNTRDIFFTLIDIDTLQDDDVQTEMDQYVLRDNKPIKIDNINGQAAAVDVEKNKVYIASDDGLTVLNKSDKANFVAFKDEDITQLFKPVNRDKLYAVIFPENFVYEIDVKEHEKTKIENVPCAFILAVDDEENIFFECDSKYVKVLLKDFEEPIEFVGIPKNSARAITVDDKNRVILATNDGIYWLKSDSLIPKKLMNLDFIPSGIAFNEENLYLSTSGVIYEFSFTICID